MAKHRFHTLDNCPAHISWLNGKDDTHCYLKYAYMIKGVTEAYYASRHSDFPKHAANEGVWK